MKKRIYGLDVLRIISALTVWAFHTNIHLGAKYGFLTDFVSMGAVFMTLFFMLSGYSLFISNAGKTFTSNGCLKRYFKKRFFGIMPMYYIAALIYVIAEFILSGGVHYYKHCFYSLLSYLVFNLCLLLYSLFLTMEERGLYHVY